VRYGPYPGAGFHVLRDGSCWPRGIARQVGYSSEFAFSNAFRREFGIAPGRFRRARREPADHGVG
jgi:transcriptional regulator GlxA family with amidase domain